MSLEISLNEASVFHEGMSDTVMTQPKILLIEDEAGLVKTLSWYFRREGYETITAGDGNEGLRLALSEKPDAILLDIMLPGLDGISICQRLRQSEKTRDVPIIMITAKSEENDQVHGLSVGADDYVTKPFSNKVLLAKLKALLRRLDAPPAEQSDSLEHLGIVVDRVRHRVTLDDHKLDLTPTEFRLLEFMMRNPGRAYNRQQLMDAAIGEGQIVLERTIDVHIKTLRRKLNAIDNNVEFIETVRGVGYRLAEERKPLES